MLGQAAAVLVSLSTLLALEVASVRFLAILYEVLALARSPGTGLLESNLLITIHVFIILVVNGTLVLVWLYAGSHAHAMAWQACRRRR
jgi:hypothetical protein